MGRRRKRRKVVRRVIRRLPTIFECPSCGAQAVRIEMKKEEGIAIVQCGNCGLSDTIKITPLSEPVDVYGEFIDRYYATIESE
ncbi:MAG: transcription elongation factor 1 family protein [Candidatus Baldrarchaeia archaeon]|nr:transcription elongation factor 1 family protein [Candidatus Baldrarchaeota archaeon]